MPDLLTHTALAFLGKALLPVRARTRVPVFVAGCVLPDLLSRGPETVLLAIHDHHPLPSPLLYGSTILHLPMGMLAWTLLLAFLFPASERVPVWCNLAAGAAFHLLLDLLQRHHGTVYVLLFPFQPLNFQIGIIGTEDTVLVAPVLAVAAGVAWYLRLRTRNRG